MDLSFSARLAESLESAQHAVQYARLDIVRRYVYGRTPSSCRSSDQQCGYYCILLVGMRGYEKLSHFMCENHHILLKRFRSTAVRDLLYLQGELVHLEAEFQAAAKKDREITGQTQHHDLDWWYLSRRQNDGLPNKQWELSLQIRSILEQYCKFFRSA